MSDQDEWVRLIECNDVVELHTVRATLEARGVPCLDEQPGACRAVEREIRASLRDLGAANLDVVETEVRRAARRAILESTGLRPVLVVHLFPES